jgi:hypothetical protein
MKAVSPLVGFVLTIFVSVMTIGLVYFGIKPAIERSIANNVMSEARGNLELLASTIERVASGAEGSKSVVSLLVSDGEYLIDKNSNNIIFTFEPSVDLGVIGRIGDKFLEKGLAFFDFFNNYLDNSLPKNLINISGNWRVYNNRLEGINGTAYYFIDKNLNGFYVSSNFGSDNNLGQIFVSPVNLSGLVLYLTFDEGSGNVVYDYSGNKNNGTLYNGTTVCSNPPNSGCPTWVDGKFGKALSFDGVDDYVKIPNQTISTPITVSAWIFYRIKGDINIIVANSIGGFYQNGFRFFVNTWTTEDRKLIIEVGNGTSGSSLSSNIGAVTPNVWHHVVAVISGPNSKLFLDGIMVASGDLLSFTQTNYINIGSTLTPSFYFKGMIDEVHIYNRALTDDEIKFLYQEGLKKLQNSGMIQFNSQIKPYIAISNPSGKIYVENLRVGNQNSKEIKLIKPFYGLEFDSNFRFSKGNHQIKIENIGFNSTSKRPIIRISES